MKYLLKFIISVILGCFILVSNLSFDNKDDKNLNKCQTFDIYKDLLVYIQIQKTGTTEFTKQVSELFLYRDSYDNNEWHPACDQNIKHIQGEIETKSVDLSFNCQRPYEQYDKYDPWFYTYRNTHKHECGLHPDYTSLIHCLHNENIFPNFNNKKFYYFTKLRDPINRYISEWQNLRRGGLWNIKSYKLFCQIRRDLCFDTKKKAQNLSLESFISCANNPANNRQTKMLALYNFKNNECFGEGVSDNDLLQRAKLTIDNLYYFGLNEYQKESAELLIKVMSCSWDEDKLIYKFNEGIYQKKTISESKLRYIEPAIIEKIKKNNQLDIQLYNYAKKIFFQKLKKYKIKH
jgi:hypothetical protein